MAVTVESLYVSSRPGSIELNAASVVLALAIGVGVRGCIRLFTSTRRFPWFRPSRPWRADAANTMLRVNKLRDFWLALVLGLAAAAASRAPAVAGKALFGYLAAILLVAASALAMPAFVITPYPFPRGFSANFSAWKPCSLRAASRLPCAGLPFSSRAPTAIAMMTAVGNHGRQLPPNRHDLDGRSIARRSLPSSAGSAAADRHPTISSGLAEELSKLPGVDAVERLRIYEISFEGMPASLASADLNVQRAHHDSDFFSGRPREQVLAELRDSNAVVVSEPFTYKHHKKVGDSITLSLREAKATFRIADVYYDYSSERGSVLMDRSTMLRYLPDPAPSNLAIYVSPDAHLETASAAVAIEKSTPPSRRFFFAFGRLNASPGVHRRNINSEIGGRGIGQVPQIVLRSIRTLPRSLE